MPGAPSAAPAPRAAEPKALPPGQVQVTCDSCGTHYRVPEHKLRQPRIVLKCSQCGNTFAPPSVGEVAGPMLSPDFYPSDELGTRAGIDYTAPDMPLPDEERLDAMFDDLGDHAVAVGAPEPNLFESASLSPDDPGLAGTSAGAEDEVDAEEAYLEATRIYDDDLAPPQHRGGVPDEQKYQIFMKPGDRRIGAPSAAGDDALPPLEEDLAQGAATSSFEAHAGAAAQSSGDDMALPPQHEVGDSGTAGAAAGTSMEKAMADSTDELGLPSLSESEARVPTDRRPVPGQDDPAIRGEGRIAMLTLAAAVIVAVAVGIWAWSFFSRQGNDELYTIKQGSEHALSLGAQLRGRYLSNKTSNMRLFVVDGDVTNRFSDEDQIGWIRIKAQALAGPEDQLPMQEAHTYVGNVLTDKQLQQWEVTAIRAYYGYNNGRDDKNFHIPRNAKIPFQIVFADVPRPVARAVAQVVSYTRHDRQVFVQSTR